jgi:hypothetical protein
MDRQWFAAAVVALVLMSAGGSAVSTGSAHALAGRYCTDFGGFDSPRNLRNGVIMVQVDKPTAGQTLAKALRHQQMA